MEGYRAPLAALGCGYSWLLRHAGRIAPRRCANALRPGKGRRHPRRDDHERML